MLAPGRFRTTQGSEPYSPWSRLHSRRQWKHQRHGLPTVIPVAVRVVGVPQVPLVLSYPAILKALSNLVSVLLKLERPADALPLAEDFRLR